MFIAAGHMISEAYLWLMDHLFIINLVFSAGTWIYSLPCIRAEFP